MLFCVYICILKPEVGKTFVSTWMKLHKCPCKVHHDVNECYKQLYNFRTWPWGTKLLFPGNQNDPPMPVIISELNQHYYRFEKKNHYSPGNIHLIWERKFKCSSCMKYLTWYPGKTNAIVAILNQLQIEKKSRDVMLMLHMKKYKLVL